MEDCTAEDVDVYNIFTDEEVKFWKIGNDVFKKLYFMIIVKKDFLQGQNTPKIGLKKFGVKFSLR